MYDRDHDSKKKQLSYISMIFVAIFWGLNWPFARMVSTAELGPVPFTSTFIRFGIGIPFLYLAVKIIDKPDSIMISSYHIKPVLGLGILQIIVHNFLFFSAMRYTSGSDGVLIINAGITTFTILIAPFVYKEERITLNKVMGMVISIIGLVIIFILSPDQEVSNRLLGNFLVMLTALNWSIYTILSKKYLQELQPLIFQFWATIFGWLMLIPIVIIEQLLNPVQQISGHTLFNLAYMGIFAAAAAYSLYNISTKYIGPSRTSIFINLTPFFGVIFSVLLLDEKFSYWYIIAFAVIISGIFVAERFRKK